MRIITNNMAIIIVFRIHGIWLFNLTISHNLYNGVTRMFRLTALYCIAPFLLLLLIGCNENPVAPITTHYHYIADTLYHGDWSEGDTLHLYHDSAWITGTVYAYQDSAKWLINSVSFVKAYETSPKAAYWNGKTIDILLSRLPMQWDKVIVRFKTEGK